MDKVEATAILVQQLARYRALTYSELVRRVNAVETAEVIVSSGVAYQVEVQFFWDGKPKRDIRVIASVDDGGLRAFCPLSADFIMAPDGSFIGE